jgi:MFS family permease
MGETDDLNLSGLFTGSSTLTTILVISVCFVDSVSIAYDGSVIGSLNAMPTYLNYFTLNTTTISLNTAAVFMGAVLMCLTAPYIINTWGRKRGILISALIQIVGTILQGAAQNIAMFIVGRIVVGAGCGLAQPSANTYVAETIPARIRAFSLGLYFSCWCVGSLVAAGICYGVRISKGRGFPSARLR